MTAHEADAMLAGYYCELAARCNYAYRNGREAWAHCRANMT